MNLASRGLRNLDAGYEKVKDNAFKAAIQKQAMKVYAESAIFAAVLTAVFVFLPF